MNQRGFTLIETFIALTILVLAVMGPLSMLSRAIADGSYAKNQIVAFYLAQEGLELVINKRDSNKLPGGPDYEAKTNWLFGLEHCLNGYCQIDAQDLIVRDCTEGQPNYCEPMKLGADNIYHYDPSSSEPTTIFNRRIKIDLIQEEDENGPVVDEDGDPVYTQAKVTSEMTWSDKNNPRTFSIDTYILK